MVVCDKFESSRVVFQRLLTLIHHCSDGHERPPVRIRAELAAPRLTRGPELAARLKNARDGSTFPVVQLQMRECDENSPLQRSVFCYSMLPLSR